VALELITQNERTQKKFKFENILITPYSVPDLQYFEVKGEEVSLSVTISCYTWFTYSKSSNYVYSSLRDAYLTVGDEV